ncbi:MAG TPA: hypothetical protein PLG48_06880 [Candidatus Avimonas sp.]|nr:hypothetical protein [Candidatus Avimonas sp.]
MTLRENVLAILNYQPYEKLPVVSFGYWNETVEIWQNRAISAKRMPKVISFTEIIPRATGIS